MKLIKQLFTSLAAAVLLSLPLQAAVLAQSTNQPITPATYVKGFSTDTIHVKFADNADVSAVTDHFSGTDTQTVNEVNGKLDKKVHSTKPLFNEPKQVIQSNRFSIQKQTGRNVPDLSEYYTIQLQPGQNAKDVANSLLSVPGIEAAYPAPLPAPAPSTPSFVSQQLYRNPSPQGLGINQLNGVPGADGSKVQLVDLEYSWNINHEDLAAARAPGAVIKYGTPVDPFNNNDHGTAIAGILAGTPNSFGVTGIAPSAKLRLENVDSLENSWNVAGAINNAIAYMKPGDVMLIEQQTWGPDGSSFVPIEWIPEVYDAIINATAKGITVVEPAGNGGQNLDNTAMYGTKFPSGKADSGAMIVGAGSNCANDGQPANSALSSSNYGSRVNVQGWGDCVVTTGYGTLYNGGINATYNGWFDGTSSASATVAGAAAVLSSAYAARYSKVATPAFILSTLINTGSPQVSLSSTNPGGHIGPLPNLQAAITSMGYAWYTTCYSASEFANLNKVAVYLKTTDLAYAQKQTTAAWGYVTYNSKPSPITPLSMAGTTCVSSVWDPSSMPLLASIDKFWNLTPQQAQKQSVLLLAFLIQLPKK